MKQVLALAAVAAVVLIVAVSPASAGAAKGPTLRSLQAQITTLQKQVKTLKKQASANENLAVASIALSACSTAVAADALQDTWTGLDGYFGAHSLPAYFGAQTPVNDYTLCSLFSVVRAHNQNPPNTNILRALLDIFKARSFAAYAVDLAGPARQLSVQFFALGQRVG